MAACKPRRDAWKGPTLRSQPSEAPWFWTSSLQNCNIIQFCCFIHLVHGTLLNSPRVLINWSSHYFGPHFKKWQYNIYHLFTIRTLQILLFHFILKRSVWRRYCLSPFHKWRNGSTERESFIQCPTSNSGCRIYTSNYKTLHYMAIVSLQTSKFMVVRHEDGTSFANLTCPVT